MCSVVSDSVFIDIALFPYCSWIPKAAVLKWFAIPPQWTMFAITLHLTQPSWVALQA